MNDDKQPLSFSSRLQNTTMRRLTPRVIIYPIILLAVVYFMHRQQKLVEATRRQPAPKPEPVMVAESQSKAELGAPQESLKPYLLLITQGELDNQPWVDELRISRKDDCNIVVMNLQNDLGAMEFFKLEKTPAAILRLGNYEIGRETGPLNKETVEKLLSRISREP